MTAERQRPGIWVFDAPIWRDPVFIAALVFAAAGAAVPLVNHSYYGSTAGALVQAVTNLVLGVVGVGVVCGIVREYVRGRTGDRQ